MYIADSAAQAVKADVKSQIDMSVDWLDRVKDYIINNGFDFVMAVMILVVGYYIARFIKRVMETMMERANYDTTAVSFIGQIVYYGMMGVVFLSAMNKVGIPTTSFLAAFGAIGLAVGLALQNNLANFASGLLILLFKPFKSGDWITVGDVSGTVSSIHFLNTVLITKEQRTVFIPNSMLTSQKVINATYLPTRNIPFIFDIGYDNNHHRAIAILRDIFKEDPRILNGADVEIGIKEFGTNSVRLAAYPLVRSEEYLKVFYDTMSTVKDRFDENGIDIPFPQRVVSFKNAPPTDIEDSLR